MQHSPPTVAFDQNHAATCDQRFAKLSAMRDALHLLISAVLADLPADAGILCVGAETGAEFDNEGGTSTPEAFQHRLEPALKLHRSNALGPRMIDEGGLFCRMQFDLQSANVCQSG